MEPVKFSAILALAFMAGTESTRGRYKNILIRGVNRIGDTVFSLPAVKALREAYPRARLTVLQKPSTAAPFGSVPLR